MAINLQNKNKYVLPEIERQGHEVKCTDGVMISSDDVAVQTIIDAYDAVPEAKAGKRAAALEETLIRANAVYGGEDGDVFANAASIRILVNINDSYRVQASGLAPKLTQLFAVWDAFQLMKTEINQLADLPAVEAYDVVNNILWP